MNVIAETAFDRAKYDARGDVLYLNVGDPGDAVSFDDTPEGHNAGWNAAANWWHLPWFTRAR